MPKMDMEAREREKEAAAKAAKKKLSKGGTDDKE